MDSNSPVTALPLVGPQYQKLLEKLDIYSVSDLLYHFPSRFLDFTSTKNIRDLRVGETVSISATVDSMENIFTKQKKMIQKAKVSNDSGEIDIIWFNQIYLSNSIKPGQQISLAGKIGWWLKKPAFISPEFEILSPDAKTAIHTRGLVPIYPETKGVSSKWLRSRIYKALQITNLPDPLPTDLLSLHNLPSINEALRAIHFPSNTAILANAQKRFALEELLILQIASEQRKLAWNLHSSSHQIFAPEVIDSYIDSLPFTPTPDQLHAIKHIASLLMQPTPMNLLLQGDVGSGKTVVAAFIGFASAANHKKTLFMAPTQILAQQHWTTLQQLMPNFKDQIGLITAKSTNISSDTKIFIGTHALINRQDLISDPDLAAVIVDEQHKFGVKQRAALTTGIKHPHYLTMTATPIPRTVTLSVMGDLDILYINTPPQGRKPITTWVVPESKRDNSYRWIASHLSEFNTRAFVVCPFISPSETAATVKSATLEHQKLVQIFPKHQVGLLHGKMPADQKELVLQAFRQGQYQILVSTPLVEVGVDIPEATIMVIEDADKFGLAQLHQLRGRVGRGQHKSYCLLYSSKSDASLRLEALANTQSGLELAELDLRLRGPGDVFGTSQHGMPTLKIASFQDFSSIEAAKLAAKQYVSELDRYPALKEKVNSARIGLISQN